MDYDTYMTKKRTEGRGTSPHLTDNKETLGLSGAEPVALNTSEEQKKRVKKERDPSSASHTIHLSIRPARRAVAVETETETGESVSAPSHHHLLRFHRHFLPWRSLVAAGEH